MRKKSALVALLAATVLCSSSVYALDSTIGLGAKSLFMYPLGESSKAQMKVKGLDIFGNVSRPSGAFLIGPQLHWRASDDFTLTLGGYFCAQPLDYVSTFCLADSLGAHALGTQFAAGLSEQGLGANFTPEQIEGALKGSLGRSFQGVLESIRREGLINPHAPTPSSLDPHTIPSEGLDHGARPDPFQPRGAHGFEHGLSGPDVLATISSTVSDDFVVRAVNLSEDELRQIASDDGQCHGFIGAAGIQPQVFDGMDNATIVEYILHVCKHKSRMARDAHATFGGAGVDAGPHTSDTAPVTSSDPVPDRRSHADGAHDDVAFQASGTASDAGVAHADLSGVLNHLDKLSSSFIKYNVSLRQHIPVVVGAEYKLYSSDTFSLGVYGSVGLGIWTAKTALRFNDLEAEVLFGSQKSSYTMVAFGGLKLGLKLGSATIGLSGGYGYFGKPDFKWAEILDSHLPHLDHEVHGAIGSAEISFEF